MQKFKAFAKKAGAAVVAVVTSSAVVKQEKSLGVMIAAGMLLSLGASDGLVQLVSQFINSL